MTDQTLPQSRSDESFDDVWVRIASAYYIGKLPKRGWAVDMAREFYNAGRSLASETKDKNRAEEICIEIFRKFDGVSITQQAPSVQLAWAHGSSLLAKEIDGE